MSDERTEEKLPDELKSVETALRGLMLATGAIDRDRLMYLAGRASALNEISSGATGSASAELSANSIPQNTGGASGTRRSIRIKRFGWPLATAALVLLSLTLGGRVIYLSGLTERIVLVERAGASGNLPIATMTVPGQGSASSMVGFLPTPGGGFSYMQLRNAVLNRGVDALPTQAVSNPASAPNAHAPRWPSLRDDLLGS